MHTFVELCSNEFSSNSILEKLNILKDEYEQLIISENELGEGDEYFSNIVAKIKNLIDLLISVQRTNNNKKEL
jgi:hypothetical protein